MTPLLDFAHNALCARPSKAKHSRSLPPNPFQQTPASSRFIPPSIEEIAPRFPQLEILELLGQGGMGAVYKARQPGLDRFVAVKILPPEVGQDPSFAERFTREARTCTSLSSQHCRRT